MRKPRSGVPAGVLYVANSALIGGGNRVLMELITRLDTSRFRPAIVSPSEGPLVEWAKGAGIDYRVIPIPERSGALKAAWAYARAVRSLGVDILHANSLEVYHGASLTGFQGVVRVCHLHLAPTSASLRWALKFGPEAIVTC
jgi:hypothetical protein